MRLEEPELTCFLAIQRRIAAAEAEAMRWRSFWAEVSQSFAAVYGLDPEDQIDATGEILFKTREPDPGRDEPGSGSLHSTADGYRLTAGGEADHG